MRCARQRRHRPRLVAFDFGGVLFDIHTDRYFTQAAAALGVSGDQIAEATFQSGVWQRVEVGALDGPGFLGAVLARLGVPDGPETRARLQRAWCAIIEFRPEAEQLLDRLGVRACAWSNTDPIHAGCIASIPALVRGLSWLTLSYELGVEKPSARFFQAALQRACLPAHAVVYVDDRADNVAAARALGVDAFCATSLAGVRTGLLARGVASA